MKTIKVKIFKSKKKLEKSFSNLAYNQICYCRKENTFYKTCGIFKESSFWIEEIDNPFESKSELSKVYKGKIERFSKGNVSYTCGYEICRDGKIYFKQNK